jgi:hypothetical protein
MPKKVFLCLNLFNKKKISMFIYFSISAKGAGTLAGSGRRPEAGAVTSKQGSCIKWATQFLTD